MQPLPRRMKTGPPPTALNARTGLLTPPGITWTARASRAADASRDLGDSAVTWTDIRFPPTGFRTLTDHRPAPNPNDRTGRPVELQRGAGQREHLAQRAGQGGSLILRATPLQLD